MSGTTRHRDPAPLSTAQLGALASSAGRELAWGLRIVRATVAACTVRAEAIPDSVARTHALAALADKRPLLDGAGLFWILPKRRHPELVRLLVTFQILANFHDHAGERAGHSTTVEPAASIATLGTIVDVQQPWPGYDDRDPPADGGYLDNLATTLRSGCSRLPHYQAARPLLTRQTERARVMDIEHTARADLAERIETFATANLTDTDTPYEWWELAAGAGSLLSAIVALALAADESTTDHDLQQAVNAYITVGIIGTLLDNYIDQAEDDTTGAHNYMHYYPDHRTAAARLGDLIEQALAQARDLRRGQRHLVIVSSMIAMYLTADNAARPQLQESTTRLIARGGSLTRLLVPILRGWRRAYRETDA